MSNIKKQSERSKKRARQKLNRNRLKAEKEARDAHQAAESQIMKDKLKKTISQKQLSRSSEGSKDSREHEEKKKEENKKLLSQKTKMLSTLNKMGLDTNSLMQACKDQSSPFMKTIQEAQVSNDDDILPPNNY